MEKGLSAVVLEYQKVQGNYKGGMVSLERCTSHPHVMKKEKLKKKMTKFTENRGQRSKTHFPQFGNQKPKLTKSVFGGERVDSLSLSLSLLILPLYIPAIRTRIQYVSVCTPPLSISLCDFPGLLSVSL